VPIGLRFRRQLPLLAALAAAIVCLVSVGTTCTCVVSHQPHQTTVHVISAIPPALPADAAATWTFAFLAALGSLLVLTRCRRSSGRASPEMLQRFLF
jgi:hypothetical protein